MVERVPFTIVGVMPPEFFGVDVGRTFDVAVPIGAEPLLRGKESVLDRRSSWWLGIGARDDRRGGGMASGTPRVPHRSGARAA